jgi:hypothetical protein
MTGSGEIGVPLGLDSIPLTFTAPGSVTDPTPPPPRSRWRILIGPPAGGYEAELTAAQSRKLTVRLTSPSELGFGLNARLPQADSIQELVTDAHVLWTSAEGVTHRLFRGRIGATGDSGDDDSHTMTATALDYRALLKRRRLYSDSQLTWTGTDQAEIALGLLTQTQARTGGALGISKAWTGVEPTGVDRDRTYVTGDSVGDRIQELSEVIDGFNWDITPASSSALALEVWYPERGNNRGVVLEYGGMVSKFSREVQTSDYANAQRYTGEEATTPSELAVSDLATRDEGRWDAVFGDTGLTTQDALDDRAEWQLDQSQVISPPYTLTLRRGTWMGPDHIWLGDTVRVIIRSGRLRVDTSIRVFEMSFTLDADGGEIVEVTLGGPKPDYRRRPNDDARRLTNLERR